MQFPKLERVQFQIHHVYFFPHFQPISLALIGSNVNHPLRNISILSLPYAGKIGLPSSSFVYINYVCFTGSPANI